MITNPATGRRVQKDGRIGRNILAAQTGGTPGMRDPAAREVLMTMHQAVDTKPEVKRRTLDILIKSTATTKLADKLEEFVKVMRSITGISSSNPLATPELIVATAIQGLVASGLAVPREIRRGATSGYKMQPGADAVVAAAIDVYALLVAEQEKGREGHMVNGNKLRQLYTHTTTETVRSERWKQYKNHLEVALILLQRGKLIEAFSDGFRTVPFPPPPRPRFSGRFAPPPRRPARLSKDPASSIPKPAAPAAGNFSGAPAEAGAPEISFSDWIPNPTAPAAASSPRRSRTSNSEADSTELSWATKRKRKEHGFLTALANVARDDPPPRSPASLAAAAAAAAAAGAESTAQFMARSTPRRITSRAPRPSRRARASRS